MKTKIASIIAATGITLSLAGLAAPAASAAPPTPAPVTDTFGSVAFCFGVPVGFFIFTICI
ncbi:hypothetical protein ACIRRA_23195 [Nocardia sp. NPDC101769]|uniref:hypothetical protein n=1 Tax=Nocardia sp. NPDC101769 TaxID=3364333 RepID=UPI00380CAC7D